jgi:hypothetical protein
MNVKKKITEKFNVNFRIEDIIPSIDVRRMNISENQ